MRIIEIVLAILAFSLTASFSVENQYSCDVDERENVTFTIKSSYPFREYEVTSSEDNDMQSISQDLNRHYSSGAEFFVAWGVLSMIYCLVAILIYMLLTANEDLERVNNILIITDLGFTIFWGIMWFIASVAWAAESNQLQDDLENIASCSGANTRDSDYQTFVQVNISIVFGFLNCFVWSCHVWWVLIDTTFYQRWRESRGHASKSDGL